MKIESWPRIFSWPIYSSSARGRSVRSSTSSCGLTGAAAIRRSVSIMRLLCLGRRGRRASSSASSGLGQQLQGLPDAVADRNAFRQLSDRARGLLVGVAQRQERVQHVGGDGGRPVHADRRRQIGAELVLELQQQALGGLLAYAGNLGKPAAVLHADGLR